jgi:acetyl esterase
VQLHPQAQSLVDWIAASGAPLLDAMSVEDARGVPGEISKRIGAGPEMAAARDISFPTPDDACVYVPAGDGSGTIVSYRGGGWMFGSLDDWDAVCRPRAVS